MTDYNYMMNFTQNATFTAQLNNQSSTEFLALQASYFQLVIINLFNFIEKLTYCHFI